MTVSQLQLSCSKGARDVALPAWSFASPMQEGGITLPPLLLRFGCSRGLGAPGHVPPEARALPWQAGGAPPAPPGQHTLQLDPAAPLGAARHPLYNLA